MRSEASELSDLLSHYGLTMKSFRVPLIKPLINEVYTVETEEHGAVCVRCQWRTRYDKIVQATPEYVRKLRAAGFTLLPIYLQTRDGDFFVSKGGITCLLSEFVHGHNYDYCERCFTSVSASVVNFIVASIRAFSITQINMCSLIDEYARDLVCVKRHILHQKILRLDPCFCNLLLEEASVWEKIINVIDGSLDLQLATTLLHGDWSERNMIMRDHSLLVACDHDTRRNIPVVQFLGGHCGRFCVNEQWGALNSDKLKHLLKLSKDMAVFAEVSKQLLYYMVALSKLVKMPFRLSWICTNEPESELLVNASSWGARQSIEVYSLSRQLC